MLQPYVVDFETEAIQPRPQYPPKPVGVAIRFPGGDMRYLAWGHPEGNNSSKDEAANILRDIWRSGREIVFHNAKFDLEVARVHFGLEYPAWDRVHDTMFKVFLKDPHAPSLGLKESSERLLDMPSDERDAVADWLVDHKVIRKGQKPGAYISLCNGRVVGEYAKGDVRRTWLLHERIELDARERAAYDRERRLLPILMRNEQIGIRFDIERAEKDVQVYETALKAADLWLAARLKTPNLNVDSDHELAEALSITRTVTNWVLTGKSKQKSVAKGNLTLDRFNDKEVFHVLGYRNRLRTVLSLNLVPWLDMARSCDGHIFTEWNQVRQAHGNDNKGTRTGRLSCSRFQNIVKDFGDRGDGWVHPGNLDLPPLPNVRRYLLPDRGDLFYHRDYNQQEFRILAHYEDADLADSYRKTPRIDYHAHVQELVHGRFGIDYGRRVVKTLNFGILYGMGIKLLAERTGLSIADATALRKAVREATPGVRSLDDELKRRGKSGEPIRTWGGRKYFCEPPRWSDEYVKEISFEYKLLNYLVQGSAADCTKEALIRYDEAKNNGRMLVTVHDEINISSPDPDEEKILKSVMESIEFDVPMLTDGKHGPSWGEIK